MKLMANTDYRVEISLEDFRKHYNASTVVSTEAISDYLYKLKDLVSSNIKVITGDITREVKDVIDIRHETLHVAKRLKYVEVKDVAVQTIPNFKGNYRDYTDTLESISKPTIEIVEKDLTNLKMLISTFINDYSDKKALDLFGVETFKRSEKTINDFNKVVSRFSTNRAGYKYVIEDLISSLDELEYLLNYIEQSSSLYSKETIDTINNNSKMVSELIDLLIETNKSTGVLNRTNSVKRDLSNSIYIVAREVEFFSSLHARHLLFYKAIRSLCEKIIELGN